ncbi:MAG TPA: hypothetical protein DIV79_11560 [Opitutae bacterium]|nr:hypothetical protein [Opitutaceae bacterium]HCR30642.1 hypothetical protein [Opitutae bacterium]
MTVEPTIEFPRVPIIFFVDARRSTATICFAKGYRGIHSTDADSLMFDPMKTFPAFLTLLCCSWTLGIEIDRSGFESGRTFAFDETENGFRLEWPTKRETAYIEFQFIPRRGNNPAAPLIREVGMDGKTIMTDLDPNYLFWIGERDLEKRSGWSIFFDRVPTRPYSVEKGYLSPNAARVYSEVNRTTIEIDGLESVHFSGSVAFTFYEGSPFFNMEARVSTEREATAFLYHVGLAKSDTKNLELQWIDPFGRPKSSDIVEETAKVYETRYRSLALSSPNGSVAISPFPHQYLYPLDFAENYGYNWAGHEYLDMVDGFAFGIRQPSIGDRRYVPWVNAPPGSLQKLGALIFISKGHGHGNLATVTRYTRGDQFKEIPGYKTFTSHYHVEHSLDYIDKQREQGVDGIPKGLQRPEFVDVFKKMGVDIVHLAEFHKGATPRMGTDERLTQLKVMHNECERLSGKGFLLLPGEEPNVHLGGHWISFFPKPVNWVLNRNEGQPFIQESENFGTVYHVGSQEDVYELLKRENGLAWTAHARIKGSTGFPDAYKDTDWFQSDRFLGGAWKAMPADYSRDSLGWRVIDLQDDMANWGHKKYTIGEVDIFKIFEGYELFGTMNINYLKLDSVPEYRDGWQPVLDVLSQGRFFVTTGEILITDFSIGDKESGDTLSLCKSSNIAHLQASLEWTYPLDRLEVVSGDGNRVYRERVSLIDTTEFGKRDLDIEIDLSDRKWARIEVWDIATNGAFTQPVWIENYN